VATVETSEDGQTWLMNQLSSAGLWGVETDIDESYIRDFGNEEVSELGFVLAELGFSTDEILRADGAKTIVSK
jgi:hypothetical protein